MHGRAEEGEGALPPVAFLPGCRPAPGCKVAQAEAQLAAPTAPRRSWGEVRWYRGPSKGSPRRWGRRLASQRWFDGCRLWAASPCRQGRAKEAVGT